MKTRKSEPTRRAYARRLFGRAAILALVAALFAFTACGGGKVEPADEGEAIAAAERLTREAAVWLRLFCTEDGMPFLDGGKEVGVYREVDGEEMERLGFRRLSDIKDYERRIFSPAQCAVVDAALFSGGGWKAALVENTELHYSGEEKQTVFICFLADPSELPFLENAAAEWDFSSATVTQNRGDRVKISVPVVGTAGESAGKTANKILDLCRVDGEWYLDNYPNVVFPETGN